MADPMEPHGPRADLRGRVLAALAFTTTPEQAADAVMALIYRVTEERDDIEITTFDDLRRGNQTFIRNRWLVARVPLAADHYEVRLLDRT